MSWRTSIPLRRSQFRRTEPIVENYMRLSKALATGMNVFACIKIVYPVFLCTTLRLPCGMEP